MNIGQYNVKKVTRVFVNIANGNMWKRITGKMLPKSPLNPKIYENYEIHGLNYMMMDWMI